MSIYENVFCIMKYYEYHKVFTIILAMSGMNPSGEPHAS
jgi:hypothetical protein